MRDLINAHFSFAQRELTAYASAIQAWHDRKRPAKRKALPNGDFRDAGDTDNTLYQGLVAVVSLQHQQIQPKVAVSRQTGFCLLRSALISAH